MAMKRVLPLVLALLLFTLPLARAEGNYGQITLSNFQVGFGAVESVSVDAVLKLGAGTSEGEGLFRADVALQGGGKSAFDASMDAADEALRVKLGGSNLYFTLPYAAIDPYMESQAQYQDAFKDRASFVAFAAKYAAQSEVKSSQMVTAARKALKAEAKGEEKVELFGETVALNRFEAELEGEALGGYLQKLAQAEPLLKPSILQLVKGIAESVGLKGPGDAGEITASAAEILKKTNLAIRADVIFWVDAEALDDEAARYAKGVAVLTVTDLNPNDGIDPKFSRLTLELAAVDAGAGEFVGIGIKMPEGGSTSLDYQMNTAYRVPENGGSADNLTLSIKVKDAETKTDMDIDATYHKATDSAGVADAKMSMSMAVMGTPVDFDFAYDGKTAAPDRQEGALRLSFSTTGLHGSLSCDALVESSPLVPLTDADFAGLEAVDLSNLSAEISQRLNLAMQAVGTKALGVIMATPGVAELISGWNIN
jgi:hypothetical protein